MEDTPKRAHTHIHIHSHTETDRQTDRHTHTHTSTKGYFFRRPSARLKSIFCRTAAAVCPCHSTCAVSTRGRVEERDKALEMKERNVVIRRKQTKAQSACTHLLGRQKQPLARLAGKVLAAVDGAVVLAAARGAKVHTDKDALAEIARAHVRNDTELATCKHAAAGISR
jgi:hypothetical protein